MNKTNTDLIRDYKADIIQALSPLKHSFEKLHQKSIIEVSEKNLDELEPWEALTARFARVTDIFMSKYLRLKILDLDPAFRGEMRDLLDKAEKSSFISNADEWMKIRELRNKIAHEYDADDLKKIFTQVLKMTAFVLQELEKDFKP